jgi:hypothetical protein
VHCDSLIDPESKWPRAGYVAITRVKDATDMAFADAINNVKFEYFTDVNAAKWRPDAEHWQAAHASATQATLARVEEHTTDAGWLALLRRVDAAANDGVHDAKCAFAEAGTMCAAADGCIACDHARACAIPVALTSLQPSHRPSSANSARASRSRSPDDAQTPAKSCRRPKIAHSHNHSN